MLIVLFPPTFSSGIRGGEKKSQAFILGIGNRGYSIFSYEKPNYQLLFNLKTFLMASYLRESQ